MAGRQPDRDKNVSFGDTRAVINKNKLKQSDHDENSLLVCMTSRSDEPLYMVVARWCLQQKRWVNRDDVASAFHIPDQRATFQLSLISRRKNRLACRARYIMEERGGPRRMEIFVDRILPVQERSRRHTVSVQQGLPAKESGIITSRRVGNGMTGNTGLWERLLRSCREEQNDE